MSEIPAEAVEVCRHVQKEGHGVVHRCLPLKGELTLPDGAVAPPFLLQTAKGVWVGAATAAVGKVYDLLGAVPQGYEERLLGDTLTVGLLEFGVPYGKGAEVKQAIGLGRILAGSPQAPISADLSPDGPWLDELSPLERAWIAARLAPDEPLLAVVHTQATASPSRSLLRKASAQLRVVLTRDRALLLGVSPVGDLIERPLPEAPLRFGDPQSRRELLVDGEVIKLSAAAGARLGLLGELFGLSGRARLREAARLAHRSGARPARGFAERLLAPLQDDPVDVLFAITVRGEDATDAERQRGAAAAVQSWWAARAGADELTAWGAGWEPGLPQLRAALDAALHIAASAPEAAAWALPLHQCLRNRVVSESEDKLQRSLADLALAEHLVIVGQGAEADRLLRARRDSLPPELGPDAPAPAVGLSGHERLLRLQIAAQGGAAQAEIGLVAALVALHPTEPEGLAALAALAARGGPALSARAAELLALLRGAPLEAAELAPGGAAQGGWSDGLRALLLPAAARAGGHLRRSIAALETLAPTDAGALPQFLEAPPEAEPLYAEVGALAALFGLPAPALRVAGGARSWTAQVFERPELTLIVGASWRGASPAARRAALARALGSAAVQLGRATEEDGLSTLPAAARIDLLARQADPAPAAVGAALRTPSPAAWRAALYGVDPQADEAPALPVPPPAPGVKGPGMGWLRERLGADAPPAPAGVEPARVSAALTTAADRAALAATGSLGAVLDALLRADPALAAIAAAAAPGRALQALCAAPESASRMAALLSFALSPELDQLREAAGLPLPLPPAALPVVEVEAPEVAAAEAVPAEVVAPEVVDPEAVPAEVVAPQADAAEAVPAEVAAAAEDDVTGVGQAPEGADQPATEATEATAEADPSARGEGT